MPARKGHLGRSRARRSALQFLPIQMVISNASSISIPVTGLLPEQQFEGYAQSRVLPYPSITQGPDGALHVAYTYYRRAIKYVPSSFGINCLEAIAVPTAHGGGQMCETLRPPPCASLFLQIHDKRLTKLAQIDFDRMSH